MFHHMEALPPVEERADCRRLANNGEMQHHRAAQLPWCDDIELWG